jgi:hypothetical protein
MTFPSPAHNNVSPELAARAIQAIILGQEYRNEISDRALNLDPGRVGTHLHLWLDAQSSRVLLCPGEGIWGRDHELASNVIQSTVWYSETNRNQHESSTMKRVCEFAFVSLLVLASSGKMHPQAAGAIAVEPDLNVANTHGNVSAMPPLPSGKSTILGGAIRDVDPVLDRFTLRIVGEKPIKILFDERTQIFLDGKKIPLRELRPSSHASVQTTLDGTAVFALSVHILSQLQQGAYSGEVRSYNPSTGELELTSGLGGEPVRFTVSNDAKFARKGQGSFISSQSGPSDLQKGSLVAIDFEPDGKGRGTITKVTVLATPGSHFVFSGNLIALDMHSGTMVVLDPTNNQSYQIEFNSSSIASMPNVRPGQQVRVAAEYDGTRYLAHNVTAY